MPATAWYLISTTHSSECSANNINEGDADKPKVLMLTRQSTGTLSYLAGKLHVKLSRYKAACIQPLPHEEYRLA